ncbi:MAG: ATP-binding protein [Polaromonas sp.]|uniref:AlbA family DNA-binding domain-containing protein n=1 Tax=Polaromonas sp. TaxID=1869339 RepID=UPI002732B04C|nr:ATP-binding protein [Polaromonas sp.]MDP3795937.1 ATP-binding protein [Polaromonas sp.]
MSTRTENGTFSISELKVALHSLIRQSALDERVIELLMQDGEPLQYERQLWDYKLKQPTATKGQTLTPDEKMPIDREWANLAKDVVSFYNSYGGYIVFGVRDSPREIIGYDGLFDVDDLNKRVHPNLPTRW